MIERSEQPGLWYAIEIHEASLSFMKEIAVVVNTLVSRVVLALYYCYVRGWLKNKNFLVRGL